MWNVLGMDSSVTWILKAGNGFPALSLSAVVFLCELSICMGIDQSPKFTRRVMSFQTVVLSRYGLKDPFCPPQHISDHVFFYLSRLTNVLWYR